MLSFSTFAQQTNPVERQVANPITDTPNINPISAEQSIAAPKATKKPSFEPEGGDGEVVVNSDRRTIEGEAGKRIVKHIGNVDAHYGIYRMQADEITIYEAENKMVAIGSVIFDQGDDQRITGARAVWNYKTKLGTFEDSTGFTNQTNDGTVIYFTAERVERVSLTEIVVIKGKFTACVEAVPKWSFTADRASIKINDRLRLKNGRFRVKDIPLMIVPFASISIKEKARSSGFLTPTFGYSGRKGLRLSTAYYQTLGDSADVTFRGDLYSKRGIGYGLDLRTRANSRSFFNAGFYAVKDRIFGPKADATHPDQGGSIVYAEGVHYFPNGFTAAADFRLTSSLAFRQEFSDGIQQIISPIENSQVFINKSWNDYTLNILARSQVISIPNVKEKTRNLPSINFEKRPSMPAFLKGVYFSFKTSLEGVSRREEVDDLALYQQMTGHDPIVTPSVVQRFDIYPQIILPLYTKYFNFTTTASARVTYYSNSFDSFRRVISDDVIRKYGELTFDVRPVALAKNYYGKNDKFRFRHVIEPYLTYRLVRGVDNFNRIIRFDHVDTIANTNEIEYGIINRFYTRKYGEAVTSEAQKLLQEKGDKSKASSVQPYEIFSLSIRGKYFLDETFGGALVPGFRNQIEPMTAMSFYTFGGVPRRFSPLNIDATYRPQKTIFVNTRLDYGLSGDGLRAISATIGYDKPLFKLFQTFYYTRAITLIPSLAQYADINGKEPGTLRGSQWSPSVFVGNRNQGLYGGASFFFDFENPRAAKQSPMISSLVTLGYAYDCCSLAMQYYTFNVGVRKENRLTFSFRLNGIGAFGTEQIGQGLR
ncbi:MAG TPA: LPS assembly protein LptD [Pyrinomonadaceae bacterium]|nr:LPS assembly protein LptD [Pyrinomonadaceae bacterium]